MSREEKYVHPVILKLELLSQGLVIDENAREALEKSTKEGYSIGATGKAFLDLVLKPGKIYVGVPAGESFADSLIVGTPFRLERIGDKWFVTKKKSEINEAGKEICVNQEKPASILMEVELFEKPSYYNKKTSRNLSMAKVMPATGDFGGATIEAKCDFWGHYDKTLKGYECKYCGIGVNFDHGRDRETKTPEDFVETVRDARKFKHFRHGPVFAGGAYPSPDRGHRIHARYLRAIREAFPDNFLRLTIAPPDREEDVDLLFSAGANLVGYNYEIFDPELYKILCPGKFHFVNKGQGHEHYDRILSYGARKFGKGALHANLLAGLEPIESTVRGIEHLASMGVIPTAFVFHPLKGTACEQQPTASVFDLIYIYRKLKEITEKFRVDTACSGCHRMMVNTKLFEGIVPFLPEITDDDIERSGLPSEDVANAPKKNFALIGI